MMTGGNCRPCDPTPGTAPGQVTRPTEKVAPAALRDFDDTETGSNAGHVGAKR
jgi:hypothetical protein